MTSLPSVGDQIGAAVNQNAALSKEGLLERLFARLFHGLVYAQIWEDPVVDMTALELGPEDNVVCIASGGCNILSYLTADVASISAVDLSPAHVALNRMKLASVQHLPDYDAMYDMLGHANLRSNVTAFDAHVAPFLDERTLAWWNTRTLFGRRKNMVARGLFHYGLLGRFLAVVHFVTGMAKVDFAPLLRAKSLDEQTAFFDREIAPLFETRFIKFVARRRASLFGLGIPPAQYDKLAADAGGDVIPVLKERTRKLFCDFPISENYFAWQAASRGYKPDGQGPVPPFLEEANYALVRENAARVDVQNVSLTDMLAKQPNASKSAYVLLDAQDWMSDEQLNALWSEITRTAVPGARVIFRTGGAADILPGRVVSDTLDRWAYQADASQAGFEADRSAIYGGFHLYRFQG